MNAALWLLIGLQLRGWARYFFRSLLTLRGALLGILGGTFFLIWLASIAFTHPPRVGSDNSFVPEYGPSLLLLYCVMNFLLSSNERGIYFTPAEINYLFPAALSRRMLLAYKILSSLIISVPSSLLLALLSRQSAASFWNAFLGLLSIALFMQLFSMALNLLAVSLGEQLYGRGRKVLAMAAFLSVGLLLWQTGAASAPLLGWLNRVDHTAVWQVVTLPLSWFFKTFSAPRLCPNLVLYASLGALVNAVLLGVIFALDVHYLEAAASASSRAYARLQRKGSSGDSRPTVSKVRLALPLPPTLGGLGTLCWRQLTTTVRMPARLVLLLVLFAALFGATRASSAPGNDAVTSAVLAGGLVLFSTVFFSSMLPFDFRGDLDRLAFLKTLPLPPWRLALGQVLTPVLLVSTLQVLVLLCVVGFSGEEAARGGWLTLPNKILLICGLFTLPVNGLFFTLENLLFLLFPTRLPANNPGDFQAVGRNVLFMMAKMALLGGVFLVTFMVGVDVGVFFPLLGLLFAWLTLAYCIAPLLALTGWAFSIFDVGRDTPV